MGGDKMKQYLLGDGGGEEKGAAQQPGAEEYREDVPEDDCTGVPRACVVLGKCLAFPLSLLPWLLGAIIFCTLNLFACVCVPCFGAAIAEATATHLAKKAVRGDLQGAKDGAKDAVGCAAKTAGGWWALNRWNKRTLLHLPRRVCNW
eukprot:Hpha_TRINITY_DN336_c0_g1::TRINITY_DN336_c0_g1_i1::g.112539::m.112539